MAVLRSVRASDTGHSRNNYLLDQHNVNADTSDRCSTISEFCDTPSVYSHAFFSPRLHDEPHSDFLTNDHPFKSPTLQPSKRRLLDDPSSSMLDLDEDVRSSIALPDAYDHEGEDGDDTKTLEGEDGEPLARMSYLGPKMRFHSRAPWELEDEPVQEADETESTGHSSFIGILIGGRAKGGQKADYSSPRTSNVGRPSAESSRSFLNPKRSFDTSTSVSHPRGALYALAQESLSTSSLSRPHHSERQEGLRGKFSLGRLRSHSPNGGVPSSPGQSAIRLPSNQRTPVAPPPPRASYDTTFSTLDVQSSSECSIHYTERQQSLPYSDPSTHPYANPDLVKSYPTDFPLLPLQSTPQSPKILPTDSNASVTESPPSTFLTKSIAKSTLVPETSAYPPKKQLSHIQNRNISSPVHVQNVLSQESPGHQQGDGSVEPTSPLPIGVNAVPNWSERGINPGFTLISLEEARAQRTRTVPIQPHTLDFNSGGEAPSGAPFRHTSPKPPAPLAGLAELNQSHTTHSSTAATVAQSRTRSISTSVKAKNVLQSFVGPKQPDRRGSEGGVNLNQASGRDIVSASGAPGKTLKHKKSGFMRLFSGSGSNAEKEERTPAVAPPPVPVLPSGLAVSRHNPKASSYRIPVPSLSASLLEAVTRHESRDLGDSSSDSYQMPARADFNDQRKTPPLLSINVGSSSSTNAFNTGPTSPGNNSSRISNQENAPQSAPPHVSDFPTLKLRPISMLFGESLGAELDMAKFSLDNVEAGSKETGGGAARRTENERSRQDSFASSSLSSAPSSAMSFADSQPSPLASSRVSISGTALTTPTTGGLISPIGPTAGPWSRDYDASIDGGLIPGSHSASSPKPTTSHVIRDSDATTTVKVLQEHLDNTNKVWQERVWGLEDEIRRMKTKVAEWKSRCIAIEENGCCKACGRKGVEIQPPLHLQQQVHRSSSPGVMNRPRARTGGSSRFANGQL